MRPAGATEAAGVAAAPGSLGGSEDFVVIDRDNKRQHLSSLRCRTVEQRASGPIEASAAGALRVRGGGSAPEPSPLDAP